MDPIELLISEHDNIKRMLKIMRQLAIKVLNTGEVNYDAFQDGIDFVREYADSHHHGKEEDILFEEMVAELEQDVEDGPIEAMFSEHDLGRYFINNLEEALKRVKLGNNDDKVDIIANTVAYVDLLEGH
ncbi:MAG: hemerythrin domain-containing protein, partial [Bacillota bacterium]